MSNRGVLRGLISGLVLGLCFYSQDGFSRTIEGPLSAKKLVSEMESQGITTLEGLLPQIAESHRTYLVLMKESRSLHQADAQNPRAIVYSKDGRFIYAFSGHPQDSNRNSLEIIEWDDQKSEFEFKTIEFGSSKPVLNTDSTRCTGCHGQNLRPIWDSYRTWPGAYGENEDSMKAEERGLFKSFLETAKNHPRYKNLMIYPTDSGYYLPSGYGYPNIVFGSRISRLNALRVAKLIEKSPKFDQYLPALLYSSSLIGCREPLLDRLVSNASFELKDKKNDQFGAELYYHLLGVDPVQELRLDHSPMSMFKSKQTYDSMTWNAGSDYMGNMVEYVLFKNIIERDPKLRAVLGTDLKTLQEEFSKNFFSSSEDLERLDALKIDTVLPYFNYSQLGRNKNQKDTCDYLSAAFEAAAKTPVVVTPPVVTPPVVTPPVVKLPTFGGCRVKSAGTDGIARTHWCCGTTVGQSYVVGRAIKGCSSGKIAKLEGNLACTASTTSFATGYVWDCLGN